MGFKLGAIQSIPAGIVGAKLSGFSNICHTSACAAPALCRKEGDAKMDVLHLAAVGVRKGSIGFHPIQAGMDEPFFGMLAYWRMLCLGISFALPKVAENMFTEVGTPQRTLQDLGPTSRFRREGR